MPFLSNPFRTRGVAFSHSCRHNAASVVIPSSREGLYFHVSERCVRLKFLLFSVWIGKKKEEERKKERKKEKEERKKLGEMVQMVDCNLVSRWIFFFFFLSFFLLFKGNWSWTWSHNFVCKTLGVLEISTVSLDLGESKCKYNDSVCGI